MGTRKIKLNWEIESPQVRYMELSIPMTTTTIHKKKKSKIRKFWDWLWCKNDIKTYIPLRSSRQADRRRRKLHYPYPTPYPTSRLNTSYRLPPPPTRYISRYRSSRLNSPTRYKSWLDNYNRTKYD